MDIEAIRQELHAEAQRIHQNFHSATSPQEQHAAEQELLGVMQKAQQLHIEDEFQVYLR